ncbi:MAG: PilN domain-containing protein [Bryobacteraceae bacterium]
MSAEFSASTHSAVGAPYDAAAAPTQSSVRDWRSWATFGSGVGIDCLGDDLLVTALNVRFGRVTMFGERRLRGISSRPAADWGAEYASFLKEFDLGHLAAHVVLPSEAVTVRVLSLPPLGAKELEAAVAFQIDSLHPYSESDDVSFAWSKLGRPGSVLVAIARRDVIRNYSTLFAEAGIALASVSVAAAAIHASLRLLAKPASTGFVALDEDEAGLEFYGESDSRAVLSFHTGSGGPRTESYVRAELRLPVDQPLEPLRDLLPAPHKKGEGSELTALAKLPYGSVRSYCAALTAACPLLSHPLNLLPKEQRQSNSRLIYLPTALGVLLLLAAGVVYAVQSSWQRKAYLKTLNAEILKLEPAARRSKSLDKDMADAISRTRQVDAFRSRSKADLDVLNELSKVLPPPTYLDSLEVKRNEVFVSGEAESAAGLLKSIDASPLFTQSSFISGISHLKASDGFRIRAVRKQVIP